MFNVRRDRWQAEDVRKASPVERPSRILKNCSKAKGPRRGRRHGAHQRAWLSHGGRARQPDKNAASAYRPLCWRWVPQPNAKVAGLRRVLSSVVCAGRLERPPSRNPSALVRCQAHLALRAVSTGPESDFSGRCDRDCGANVLYLPSIPTVLHSRGESFHGNMGLTDEKRLYGLARNDRIFAARATYPCCSIASASPVRAGANVG